MSRLKSASSPQKPDSNAMTRKHHSPSKTSPNQSPRHNNDHLSPQPCPESPIVRSKKDSHQLTGDFEKDFCTLASRIGLSILFIYRDKIPECSSRAEVSRSKFERPSLVSLETLKDGEKKKQSLHDDQPKKENTVEIVSEWENHKEQIKEIHIKGWTIDGPVIGILSRTLSNLDHLKVINLGGVNLNDDSLQRVGKCLHSTCSLKTLILDGNNSTIEQRFGIFLIEKGSFHLEDLSLRNCSVTDIGASHLADALVNNKSLLILNLCFNQIGDKGMEYLSKSLQTNRTLLSLNVGSNKITDQGVKYLSDAISTFPLTHDQVVSRRQRLSVLAEEARQLAAENLLSSSPVETKISREKTSPRMSSKSRSNKEKHSDLPKVQRITRQTSKLNEKNRLAVQSNIDGDFTFIDPLLEKAFESEGQLWIPGNRSLINLNISRNELSDVGVQMLYSAVKYQVDFARQHKKVNGVGLLRLNVGNKGFGSEDSMYLALKDLMRTRDPLIKIKAMDSKDYSRANSRRSSRPIEM